MDVKTATDVGQVRENNEDALWVGDKVLVVCDGMGGHVAGEVASGLAVQAIRAFSFRGLVPEQEALSAIEQAQAMVLAAAEDNADYHGMGTTITLALLSEPSAEGQVALTVGHVGDSRCYVFTDGVLEQVTSDHSVVGELVRSGTITPAEARLHTKKHVLTQVLGSSSIEVEVLTKNLALGSLVLLCTDGLTDLVEDILIEQTLQTGFDSSNLAQDLVDIANEFGGVDNVTVIVAKV